MSIVLKLKNTLALITILICSSLAGQNTVEQLEQKVVELEESGNKVELASTHNKLAHTYWQQGNLDKAIESFNKSLELNTTLKNSNAQRIITGYLGLIYLEKEEYQSAIDIFNESRKLNERAGKTQELISDNYNIALAYQALSEFKQSNKYAQDALSKSIEVNNLKSTKSCYLLLAENSEKLGDNKNAADYYEKFNTISKHLQQQQMTQLEVEKKQIQTEVHKKETELKSARNTFNEEIADKDSAILNQQALHEAKIREAEVLQEERDQKNKSRLMYLSTVIAFFLIILVLFSFQNRMRKKANIRLKEQNAEIEQQKSEIEKQRDLVTKQKKNLTDSIQYARRIQAAVLPRQEALHEHFKESFILHKPRDIVSGDFYWYAQKDNLFVIAAADCTGHGVPGAFMSMLGVAYLNEIVNKIAINAHINALNADEILNQLREKVISSLHQSDNKRDPKDGMDIALCIIDFDKKKLQFSGAYNPLLIIRDGEIIRYRADKMPVSYHRRRNDPFSKQIIDLKENDSLYLFSDGYNDQFGGPKGMKFLMKQFQKVLLEIHHRPMQEQKSLLTKIFDDWRGDYTQIDDVLVIGLRFTTKSKDQVINWHNKTFLIAEDTDMNYFLIVEVLKKTKANLVRVKNGKEAVEFIRANHTDLVLMDINMPVMDGYEATRLIKELRDDIPIIIQTAVHEDGKENASKAGADDFIAKPIDLKTFMEKIAALVN